MFGYQKNSNVQAKGARPGGQTVTHVVSSTMVTGLLQALLRDRLCQGPGAEDTEVQVRRGLLGGFPLARQVPLSLQSDGTRAGSCSGR